MDAPFETPREEGYTPVPWTPPSGPPCTPWHLDPPWTPQAPGPLLYFERDGACCDANGCTLCLVHCGGCLFPCTLRGSGRGRSAGAGVGGTGFNYMDWEKV